MQPSTFIDRRTESNSPVSRSSSVGPYAEDQVNRSLSELKAVGSAAYKEVWDEFYNWEPGYCDQILGTLPLLAAKTEVFKVAREMMVGFLDDTRDLGSGLETKHPRTTDVVVASMTHYDADGRGSIKQLIIPVTTVDLGLVPPHPVYESCPPVSRSVRPDGHRHEDLVAFLPYADDKTFPAIEYLGGFESFDWETPFDPDLEMIQLETVRRLHVMHGIVLQDISRMAIFNPLYVSHNTGLLWDQSQRDFLHWPGAFQVALEEDLPRSHAPHPDDMQGRLTSVLRIFCPSLNCLSPLCQTHGNLHTNTYLPSKKPQVTGESMRLSEGDPCGPRCFRLIQDFDQFMETLPPSPIKASNITSLDILATVLGIAPDLYPCQLAVLCLKPCQEVFTQRLHLFPDHTILPSTSHSTSVEPSTDADTERETHLYLDNNQQRKKKKKKKRIRTKLEFVDEPSHFSCALPAACAHPGLCATNQCPCWLAKQHCTLACRCGISCARQWPPCNCTNGRCVPETCSCWHGGRECVPGICLKCDAA
ncbi:hypothetical protein PAXRUDRAFT_33188 [Paxillus rubicundulus Ve08.2h10]|uniref:Unplaced genomic scaffold scaffold_246, whole genome shotgun sequence n=1 Tax=Paxillus rubicundulus Ve08.2h10 TaxID=930991 RepID=A0A0D0E8L6_9AGAM|nr:hypothetical protein PAXRUDRAFT_33188 [Paxillus rubicundulus Ve08.2h10]